MNSVGRVNNLKTIAILVEIKTATLHASVTASFTYVTLRYITHSDISQIDCHMRSKSGVYMYIADIVILKFAYVFSIK